MWKNVHEGCCEGEFGTQKVEVGKQTNKQTHKKTFIYLFFLHFLACFHGLRHHCCCEDVNFIFFLSWQVHEFQGELLECCLIFCKY